MALPPFRSPLVQIVLLGFVLFCTAGMFNAVSGMGGGGQVDTVIASKANTALYACFALFGVLAGAVNNLLGEKVIMFCGALTYILYVASFLAFNHIQSTAFAVIAGAVLGIGAALLWTAQGAIMMSYPTEDKKGTFISVFWVIFNLGGVLGGLIPFAANYESEAGSVSDGTYIAFMVLMFAGACVSLFMANPKTVIRDDGTPVVIEKARGVREELVGLFKAATDWRMLCLVPMFLASNWFYGYQFNGVNGFLFNVRTRGLNNVFYWGAQMAGALVIGRFLDMQHFRRSTKAVYSLVVMGVLFSIIWGGGLALQLQYDRDDVKWNLDFKDSARASGPIILFLFYGMLDAVLQSWCYWIMGSLTNDPAVLARYAGLYKGIQSAGGAISWAIDVAEVSYLVQLIINWALLVAALPFAYAVARQVKDTSHDAVEAAKMHEMSLQRGDA